jgi:hypothetical protein
VRVESIVKLIELAVGESMARSKRLQLSVCLVVLWGVVSTGCNHGDGIGRVVVKGEVTLKQQPVEDGQIRFVPIGNTAGPITIEPIQGGKYTCEHNGGIPIGEHRVEILAWDPKVPQPLGPGQPPRPQWAPPQYNRESKLTAAIDGSDDPHTQNFDL